MGRGRSFKVNPEDLLEVISQLKTRCFVNGKQVGPTDSVYLEIAELLGHAVTPKSVYVFIKQNDKAKQKYEEWGVTTDQQQLSSQIESSDNTSEDCDDQNHTVEQFDITLSAKEWADMAPKELYYKRKNADSGKQHKALTPNVWTHIVNDHFWLVTRLNCCLVFKRAAVLETGCYYVKMVATCKACSGNFVGTIDTVPAEGQRVVIRCHYSSNKLCKTAPAKRMMKGLAREEPKTSLIIKRETASGYRAKLAHNLMKYGEKEPAHLPTLNALRCLKYRENEDEHVEKSVIEALLKAKYTTPFKESIYNVGLDKFFVHYWTPSQLNCYREICDKTDISTLFIDATGGVVKKISRPFKNKSSHIFLYQAVAMARDGTSFPVSQMLSEKHDNISINSWLEEWKRNGAPVPKTLVCDRSKALLSGAVKAYTGHATLSGYISNCYMILVNGSNVPRPLCFVRCDIAHLLKNITSWKPVKSMSYGIKNFYVRSICEILKATDLANVKKIIEAIFLVAESENIGRKVVNGVLIENEDIAAEKARKLLKEAISNGSFEQSPCSIDDDDQDKSSECDSTEVLVSSNISPFRSWAEGILQESRQQLTTEAEHYNALYCPQIVQCVLDLTEDLPLVTAIMVPIFGYGGNTASSACVESSFNNLKNRLFQSDVLPMRVDDFLTKHIVRIEGQLKIVASTFENDIATSAVENRDSSLSNQLVDLNHVESSQISATCPECSKGNLPGGAHTCVKCKEPVHIIFDTCSRPINSEEGYGQKRLCISCYKSNLPEDASRENWGGLGYSPVKNQPQRNSSNNLIKPPIKRLSESDDKVNLEPKKIKSTKSYLVRQPDIGNIDVSGKMVKTVAILKNGNRAQDLKPLKMRGVLMTKVTLSNTCAFDSLSQLVACAYNDSEQLKLFVDTAAGTSNTVGPQFLHFCKTLATKAVSAAMYKMRLELLLQTFTNKDKYPAGITVLNTECTAVTIVSKMAQEYASSTVTTLCQLCNSTSSIAQACISVVISPNELKDMCGKIIEILKRRTVVCSVTCTGDKTLTTVSSKNWLFVEILSDSCVEDTDVAPEIMVKPNDLPMSMEINGLVYTMRGFIGFSGRRESLTNVGHYVSFTKRINETWEMYDDMKDSKINISPSIPVPCQVILFTV